jgi:hypothetical protein
MTTKMLEIRYKDMSIPVLAIRMEAANKEEEAFFERIGYDEFNILLTRLDDSRNPQIKVTPYSWDDEEPFMYSAHFYIEHHFDEIPDNSVVDIGFIHGETQEPKKSDIWK